MRDRPARAPHRRARKMWSFCAKAMRVASAQRLHISRARRCGARAGSPRIRRCGLLSRRGCTPFTRGVAGHALARPASGDASCFGAEATHLKTDSQSFGRYDPCFHAIRSAPARQNHENSNIPTNTHHVRAWRELAAGAIANEFLIQVPHPARSRAGASKPRTRHGNFSLT